MTMEKEKKRTMFWKRSHSEKNLEAAPTSSDPAYTSSNDLAFQPDSNDFQEKDVNFAALFMPFVKNYVANLTHNKSPTKLPYPPVFYYPASSLQLQMSLQMAHVDYLVNANSLATPQERFLAVLKYTLSTCSLTKFPYKPIIAFLGETAQSYTTHATNSAFDTTSYVAEQTEKDPAGCAYYISNPTRGVTHEGHVALVPKFKQAHVHVDFVGHRKTILAHPQGLWNETYFGNVPDLNIRLLRMHTELGGELSLVCQETGYAAKIQFKDKPIFGGTKNAVSGHVTLNGREVFSIDGAWDSVIYIIDPISKQRFELLNQTVPKLKVESYPLDQQLPTSGEREWGQLVDCLHRKDFEQAKAIKAQIDAAHHERHAYWEANGGFVPTLFHRVQGGAWQINNPSIVAANNGIPHM